LVGEVLEMEQRERRRWDRGGRTMRGGIGPEVEKQRAVALQQFWVKEVLGASPSFSYAGDRQQ
jgi:hypothetical protein